MRDTGEKFKLIRYFHEVNDAFSGRFCYTETALISKG